MPVRLWQSALAPAGPQAGHIAQLTWLLLAVTALVSVLVLGTLAWALVRGHRRRGEHARDAGAAAERSMAQAVGGALVVTVIILFGILLSSFWTGRAIASLSASNAAAVTINGHQFWWEVQYEDATPSRRVTTANELHVPVGRPVKLQLGSRDVIHSFWVPMLHGKRDLIPVTRRHCGFRRTSAGEFQGQCAEFCGRQHAHMAIGWWRRADADFDRWLDAQRGRRGGAGHRAGAAWTRCVPHEPLQRVSHDPRHAGQRAHRSRPDARRVARQRSAPGPCR